MNDKEFEKFDEQMMKATKSLRDKPVPSGLLKGFSASVERRLEAAKQPLPAWRRVFSPALVPVFAVMVLASVVVLRTPVSTDLSTPSTRTVDYAQLNDTEMDIDVEIQTLKELGAWDDNDDSLLGGDEAAVQELELSSGSKTDLSSIA